MSFPQQKAFYLQEDFEPFGQEGDIVYPTDPNLRRFSVNIYGEVGVFDYWSNEHGLIPLASTGKKDSKDNVIFDGHILSRGYEKNCERWLCLWDKRKFYLKGVNVNDYELLEYTIESNSLRIDGHILTDHQLLPNHFGVKQYFNQYGTDT